MTRSDGKRTGVGRRLAGVILLLQASAVPAAGADSKDDIVLGALLAEFHLAIAASLTPAAEQPRSGYGEKIIADAGQLARISHAAADRAGLDLALGAFLAFAATRGKDSALPLSPADSRAFACQLIGADPVGFAELGRRLKIDAAGADACVRAFAGSSAAWNERFSPLRLGPGLTPPEGAGPLYIELAPAFSPASEAIGAMLGESNLYQLLAERLNGEMLMPTGRILLVTECGGTQAFYNPDRREIVLCNERIAAWIAASAAAED